MIRTIPLLFALALGLIAGCGRLGCAERHVGPVPEGEAPIARVSTSTGAEASVLYLGHSLVGHDLPHMVASFARARGKVHRVRNQSGWGTPLSAHWRWDGDFDGSFVPSGFLEEVKGELLYEMEAKLLLDRGQTDHLVVTEVNSCPMGKPGAWKVPCYAPADWCCTPDALESWVRHARSARPDIRVLLYQTWKSTADEGGIEAWAKVTKRDLGWHRAVAAEVNRRLGPDGGPPIEVLPGGSALAAVVLAAERGALKELGVPDGASLFLDEVHVTPLGFYPVALAHFAALYGDDPRGLPSRVDVSADSKGRALVEGGLDVDPKLAERLQEIVAKTLAGL